MSFKFSFDDREIECREGWTVGAALVAAGTRSWRTTRLEGTPRGLFCGIGVCFDCLVTVNGTPSVRACLQPAAPNDVVTTQRGAGHDDLAC